MIRKLQILFIALTLLGFTLPIVRFNKSGTVSEKENRTLATRPPLICDGHLNGKLFGQYSAYFDDRLGGRQRLISLNKLVDDSLNPNGFAVSSRAFEGKNGWYFYIDQCDGNNLLDFFKQNLFSDGQCADFKKRVVTTVAWCAEQRIPCIFLICPNKHSVYSEYYRFERPDGITRADQIAEVFEELGVPYLFPRDFLLARKTEFDFPLYYETDTHWNSQGAYLAFTLLREKIQAVFPDVSFPQIEYKTEVENSMTAGDILPMLSVKEAKSTQPKLSPVGHKNTDFYTYIKNEGTNGVHTKGADASFPRALIFRDSFFSALEPFVSPLFSEAKYVWKQFDEQDKEMILQYKPDIIIFESVERAASTIVR